MKNRKFRRTELSFGDMNKRFFICGDSTIIVLTNKDKNIKGHIQWHIHSDISYVTIQSGSTNDNNSLCHYDSEFAGNFAAVQDTFINKEATATWLQSEVSGYTFLCNEAVLSYINDKSLAYMFNKVMKINFSDIKFNRPKTCPGLNFKPLSQFQSRFYINTTTREVSVLMHMDHERSAIWTLHGSSFHRITYFNDIFDYDTVHNLSGIERYNIANGSEWKKEQYDRNYFYSYLNEQQMMNHSLEHYTLRNYIAKLYNTQANLWFKLVTKKIYV